MIWVMPPQKRRGDSASTSMMVEAATANAYFGDAVHGRRLGGFAHREMPLDRVNVNQGIVHEAPDRDQQADEGKTSSG